MNVDPSHIWISLQLCDSSFPTGSFSHSGGLESVVSHGLVSRSSFVSFLSLYLEQSLYQMLPLLSSVHIPLNNTESFNDFFSKYAEGDGLCHSLITNEVSRRASMNQGKCFIRACTETFSYKYPQIMQFYDTMNRKVQDGRINCHYVPVFGAICGLLRLPLDLTQRLYLRCLLRDLISAAHRLNVVGPLEGSRIQAEYAGVIERMLQQYSSSSIAEPIQTCPMLELMQASHDNLYSRLFNS